jgi:hypothetical protein
MLLHFVVISIFDRNTGDANLGPKDPDLANQAVSEQFVRLGMKPTKPHDPLWYLMSPAARRRSVTRPIPTHTVCRRARGRQDKPLGRPEKGSNRISAGRLQHMSQILQVPVPFFFEGAPAAAGTFDGIAFDRTAATLNRCSHRGDRCLGTPSILPTSTSGVVSECGGVCST